MLRLDDAWSVSSDLPYLFLQPAPPFPTSSQRRLSPYLIIPASRLALGVFVWVLYFWCNSLQPVPTFSRTYTPFAFAIPPISHPQLASFSYLIVTYRIALFARSVFLLSHPFIRWTLYPRGIVH